jgi:hypothetical protein
LLLLLLLLLFYHSFFSVVSGALIFQSEDLISMATLCYTCVVLVCSLTLLLEANSVSMVLLAVISFVIVLYWCTFLLLSSVVTMSRDFGSFVLLQSQPLFWFTVMLCVVVCLLPLVIVRALRRMFAPRPFEVRKTIAMQCV